MKNTPQLENGFVQISNEIMEDWTRINLSPYQWAVLLHIIRFTYGYNLKQNRISITHISRGTGIHLAHVSRALKELKDMGIVTSRGKFRGYHKDTKDWKLPIREPKYTSRGISRSYDEPQQVRNIPAEVLNQNLPALVRKLTGTGKESLPVLAGNKENIKKTKKESKNNKEVKNIFEFYLKISGTKERALPSRKIKITTRLKTFTEEEIKRAITNCFEDSFYTGENDRSWKADADYIFSKDEVIDRLLNLKPLPLVKTKPDTFKEAYEKRKLEANLLSDRQIARERSGKI